jgi:type 2 lantibiotic biosynthesis protein LanM
VLTERARAFASSPVLVNERGRKRLAKWKSQPPFDSGSLFRQRLEQDGLTESKLLELLSEHLEDSRQAATEPPDWAVEVAETLGDSTNGDISFGPHRWRDSSHLRFLELVQPFVRRAVRQLRNRLRAPPFLEKPLPFDVDTVERIFVGLLPDRLLPILLRTIVLELNVARVQGLLAGETSQERFESFIERIQQPQVRLEFFREYPVLARLVVTALESWLNCSLEFLQRWCADWPAIRAEFALATDPDPLASIESDAGDRHRGGRTVWIVQCRSGFKVVYKPKPLAVDQHFQQLLGWLNDHGVAAPFRQLKILDRGAYGWEEFVSPKGCSSREEVGRFYERSGGYLALLHGLAATDFHHENVLAVGEHPVLIDLEALLHASALEPEATEAGDLAGQSFAESVLGSGLLPLPIWSGKAGEVMDLSGLGADMGKKLPMRIPGWKDIGTDQMYFARQQAAIDSSDHQPTLDGVPARPLDYLDALERGFKQVYQLLEKHRDELLAPGGWLERFAHDEVRVVLRNTARYSELEHEGSHPDVLRDALDRDRLFDRLWEDVKDRPRLAQLIPAEIEDLWRGDVPLFTTRPDSRDLWAGHDRHFKDLLTESGLECARRRVARLGPDDLKRQLWFLRSSLSTLASSARPAARTRAASSQVTPATATREQLLAAACAIGDRLAETAYHGSGDISWIGLSTVREQQWVLLPLGFDLYDGVPGVGLFLAYLGAVSGNERYTQLASAAIETVRRKLRANGAKKGWSEIGGFLGWGGILYATAHLGVLWGQPEMLAEAQGWLGMLPERIEKDTTLDVIAGAAGCIAGLLTLHACSPSPRILELAIQCGEHLLAKSRAMPQGLGWDPPFPCHGPLTGFSHGAAGITWALLELAVQTGQERFRAAALDGISYERSLFSSEAGNWPDLRTQDTEPKGQSAEKPSFQVTWCHGAPGIGLARLLCRRHVADPFFDTEIQTALRTTLSSGFGFNHSLCHGDLGNLELLLEAGRAFPESSWGREADRLAANILSSIQHDGWLCGNPLAVEAPGLMTGIAGLGYGLLRCAEPARVPSVLCLAPPVREADPPTLTLNWVP